MSFVVRECLPEDAGAYTCLAENSAGKTSCCAAVFVRGEEDTGDGSIIGHRRQFMIISLIFRKWVYNTDYKLCLLQVIIQGSSFNGICILLVTLITTSRSFISNVLRSLLFLLLTTNPDFETICGVQNRVSNIPTSASKSRVENGSSPQFPKDKLQKFRGSICTSPTGSDKLSPVSTPRGNDSFHIIGTKDLIILWHF